MKPITRPFPSQRLQGRHNYREWKRAFSTAVWAEDLHDIFSGSATSYPHNLDPDDYIRHDTHTGRNVDQTASLLAFIAAQHQAQTYHERLRRARLLLLEWVSPPIGARVSLSTSLADAYNMVETSYGMSIAEEAKASPRILSASYFDDCVCMTEYINSHREARANKLALGQEESVAERVQRMLRGLGPGWDGFADRYRKERGSDAPEFDVEHLEDRLLDEECSKRLATGC